MELSNCVTEGLYLGGILAALNERDLADKGITHILSVDENPLPDQLTQRFVYKHVQALDVADCDLLSRFPETFVFIEQARSTGGRVLVHCQAGMSRSATVVCAYLMQKTSAGKDGVLEMMVASRPCVCPNSGFMDQLSLFEAMGCQVIRTHPRYRAWQLRNLADRFHAGYGVPGSQDMDVLSGLMLESDFSSGGNDAYYKCRKCRMILFRHGAVTSHAAGKGEQAFGWRGTDPTKQQHGQEAHLAAVQPQQQGGDQELCQRSLFVDPLSWMKGKIHDTSGKLHCPKCDVKIGSYVWYGEKCPCGSWVAPAFHIDTGKVDKIPFQTVAPSSRIAAVAPIIPSASSRQSAAIHPHPNLQHQQPSSSSSSSSPSYVVPVPGSTTGPATPDGGMESAALLARVSGSSSSSSSSSRGDFLPQQAMGPSHSFPPSSSSSSSSSSSAMGLGAPRGAKSKSNTPIVAAVAPLVSTVTASGGDSGGGGSGGGSGVVSMMDVDS